MVQGPLNGAMMGTGISTAARRERRDARSFTAVPLTGIGDGEGARPIGCDRAGVVAWKAIIMGNYPTAIALRDAVARRKIWIGKLAAQMLRLPTFTLVSTHSSVDLSIVTVGELGFGSDGASFAAIHAHAVAIGLDLCPPEVGPQLRLQYLDQRIGEYLTVGMTPLPTADGSDACFVVGNGGAGLFLIGRSAAPNMAIPPQSIFVFVLRH